MISLPGSIVGDDAKTFQQFQPNYGQENDDNNIPKDGLQQYNPEYPPNSHRAQPRPPPRLIKRPPPRPLANTNALPQIHQNQSYGY